MQPVEKYVFIKPDLGKTYVVSEKLIRESKELYIEFVDSNDEVVSRDDFKGYLENKVSRC
jgi:hypothetical protein